ncbi:MAG TPA: acylphosphatase [Caulobacteraceae bacterium]|jgi:acylphosphatase
MARIAIHLIISGCVQGVGFRWWVRARAQRLGLSGWVRNRADGTVELVAAGSAEAVEQLAAGCRRGPSSARVVSVERSDAADPGPGDFEARPTV